MIKGWVTAAWRQSETGRDVREYRITASGRRHLETEMAQYRRTARAIDWLLDKA
jgi:DNA-binding PadR family transcriptional regulator